MIHNFPELVVIVDIHYRKLQAIKTAISFAEWRADTKKIAELKTKEAAIRKKINGYLLFYKTQKADNYIEQRIYGKQLDKLEHYLTNEFGKGNGEPLNQ